MVHRRHNLPNRGFLSYQPFAAQAKAVPKTTGAYTESISTGPELMQIYLLSSAVTCCFN